MRCLLKSPCDVLERKRALAATARDALRRVAKTPMVLLGVTPEEPDPDLGWIVPAHRRHDFAPVRRFVEKPPSEMVSGLLARGGVWNSFIFAVSGRHLLALFKRRLPDLTATLSRALEADGGTPGEAVAAAYARLSDTDFSRNIHRLVAGVIWADQIRNGDPYELSNGHAIRCMTTGGRGSDANAVGAAVLKSDPDVEEAGIDTGYSPEPGMLRAPDVAVGNVPKEPGWVQGVLPLAVEYADSGQDEEDLATKIHELLSAGTRWIWVVRLNGPRRVEVHEAGKKMQLVRPGEELLASGILRNPVPVEALYDWDAGSKATLRNLLQRQGYDNLDAVREEGREEGELASLRESIFETFTVRNLTVGSALRDAVSTCGDRDILKRWRRQAITASTSDELLDQS